MPKGNARISLKSENTKDTMGALEAGGGGNTRDWFTGWMELESAERDERKGGHLGVSLKPGAKEVPRNLHG